MKMSGGPASVNFKIFLLIIALAIAAGTLFYTQQLVNKLQQRERNIVQLYARAIEHVANSDVQDINFIFDNFIRPIDFPIILTDANDKVNIESKSDVKNVEIDSTFTKEQRKAFLENYLKEIDKIHQPINVVYADTLILQRIHYGDSALVMQLK